MLFHLFHLFQSLIYKGKLGNWVVERVRNGLGFPAISI